MQTKEPRVLQLIDSLAAGGAERVSVNLANALSEAGIKSFLCATRQDGPLEQFINRNVKKLILHKTSTIDVKAISALVKFIHHNDINIIHAHSSSFFMAVLCKPFVSVKILWHDHNGDRYKAEKRFNKNIIRFSCFFDASIAVNERLAQWSRDNLQLDSNKITYIQNFAQLSEQHTQPDLPGTKETRIVCLANLRPQKDHMTLLNAFKSNVVNHSEWHLLLVGQDNEDDYSDLIKNYIEEENLEHNAHILGSRSDTADILVHSAIGVLSSKSEGLPVALLEYGLSGLPVVCTDVGQCAEVLGQGKYGVVVPPESPAMLGKALGELMADETKRKQYAADFSHHVHARYSKDAVMDELLKIYQGLLDA